MVSIISTCLDSITHSRIFETEKLFMHESFLRFRSVFSPQMLQLEMRLVPAVASLNEDWFDCNICCFFISNILHSAKISLASCIISFFITLHWQNQSRTLLMKDSFYLFSFNKYFNNNNINTIYFHCLLKSHLQCKHVKFKMRLGFFLHRVCV